MARAWFLESSSPFTLPRAFPASSRRSLVVSARLQAARLAFHASLAGRLHLLVSQLSSCSFTCHSAVSQLGYGCIKTARFQC